MANYISFQQNKLLKVSVLEVMSRLGLSWPTFTGSVVFAITLVQQRSSVLFSTLCYTVLDVSMRSFEEV